MKTLLIASILGISIWGTAWGESLQIVQPVPFVLVELFASEGCSSCPPADDLVRKVTQENKGKRVFTLTFEVDYWDYLGWKDQFSQADFTQRQQEYARVMANSSVYTPQAIVNGQEAFVGSDEARLRKSIDDYLKVPAENMISLNVTAQNEAIEITYNCANLTPKTLIHFALVEKEAQVSVTAGENSGHTLNHTNVVREFKTIPLTQLGGNVTFQRPAASKDAQFALIAYLQNMDTMHIIAADSLDLHF